MNDVERTIAAIAAAQHGVFSRRQARGAGLSGSAVSRRVSSGLWVPCSVTGLRPAGSLVGHRGLLQAGLLDLGPDALVSARASAHLLGLDGFGEGPAMFLVPRSGRHRRSIGSVRSTGSIVPLDRTVVDGLPTTSATRTVIELLAVGTVEEACDALDSAIRMRLTAHAVIARRLDELGRRGRDGVALFEQLVRAGLVESGLERRFVRAVRDAGLPEPVLQRRHQLPGVGTVRVDFEFPGTPIVVEVGGRRGYLSAGERQQKERRRNALQLHGKVVYFFTTADVTDHPDRLVATLAAALLVTDRCA